MVPLKKFDEKKKRKKRIKTYLDVAVVVDKKTSVLLGDLSELNADIAVKAAAEKCLSRLKSNTGTFAPVAADNNSVRRHDTLFFFLVTGCN